MVPVQRRRVAVTAAALAILVLGGGCGGSQDSGKGATSSAKAAATPSPTPTEGPRTAVKKPAKPRSEVTVGPSGDQKGVLGNLPGSTQPGCVVVGRKARDIRSGDMAAGPFDTARKAYVPRNPKKRLVNLYFIPQHAKDLKAITVRGRNARTGATFVQGSSQVADAEQAKFFQLALKVPSPGRWTISASTGQDNGCWIVDLA